MQKNDAKEINDTIEIIFFLLQTCFSKKVLLLLALTPTGNSEGILRKSLYHCRLLAGC